MNATVCLEGDIDVGTATSENVSLYCQYHLRRHHNLFMAALRI